MGLWIFSLKYCITNNIIFSKPEMAMLLVLEVYNLMSLYRRKFTNNICSTETNAMVY